MVVMGWRCTRGHSANVAVILNTANGYLRNCPATVLDTKSLFRESVEDLISNPILRHD